MRLWFIFLEHYRHPPAGGSNLSLFSLPLREQRGVSRPAPPGQQPGTGGSGGGLHRDGERRGRGRQPGLPRAALPRQQGAASAGGASRRWWCGPDRSNPGVSAGLPEVLVPPAASGREDEPQPEGPAGLAVLRQSHRPERPAAAGGGGAHRRLGRLPSVSRAASKPAAA